jgi:DNA-binding transcriptional MerR regulator
MTDYFTSRKNIFSASDWFDENFFADFLNSESEAKRSLNEQIHKIGDERLSSRVLNHWYEAGILDDDRPNGKGWKKFSISELIWIQIVIKLRGFGLDLVRIKKVKQEINLYHSSVNISKCPLLDFYIILSTITSSPIKFANASGLLQEDFISIDMNKLVSKFHIGKNIKTDYLGYSDVPKSPIQRKVEESLSTDDIQSLTIKVKDKDYVVDEEFFINDRAKANALMSILDFGKLVENKNAGKSTFQITNKKKIKKG